MKLISSFFILSISITCLGQNEFYFPFGKNVNLRDYSDNQSSTIDSFIISLPPELYYYKNDPGIKDHLFAIDINGDQLSDIIFNGITGSDYNYLFVYINTGESFVNVFSGGETIDKIVFSNNKLDMLYVEDDDCCCTYINTATIYKLDNSTLFPQFNILKRQYAVENIILPSNYYPIEKKLKVKDSDCKVRFSPEKNDTSTSYYCGDEGQGNIIGSLKKNSFLFVLAEQSDPAGSVWYFCAIPDDINFISTIYYETSNNPEYYQLGWVSSIFVTSDK